MNWDKLYVRRTVNPALMVHFGWAQYKRQAHHDGLPKGQPLPCPSTLRQAQDDAGSGRGLATPRQATPGRDRPSPSGPTGRRHRRPRPPPSIPVVVPIKRAARTVPLVGHQPTGCASTLPHLHLSIGLIITEEAPRRIGHLGDFCIGQVSNLFLGQVTNLCRRARAIASARLETPSLHRILLT
jgi:hypothetical protein